MTEQVMCMDATPPRSYTSWPGGWHGDALLSGKIYTIRGVSTPDIPSDLGYLLHEARTWTQSRNKSELGYGQWRFHPIRDSDIEIFREIACKAVKLKALVRVQ